MKKFRFLLYLLVAGSLTFVACTKDDEDDAGDDTPPVKKEMKVVKMINEDGSYSEVLYNDDNNIKQILYKDAAGDDLPYYDDFLYTGTNVTTYTNYNNGAPNIRFIITYTGDKPVSAIYQVNNAGTLEDTYTLDFVFTGDQLTEYTYSMDLAGTATPVLKFEFSYSGDNVSKTLTYGYTASGLAMQSTVMNEYDSKKFYMYGYGIDYVFGNDRFLSPNNNTKTTKTDGADAPVDAESYNFTYEYNDNDYPTKETKKTFDDQSTVITTFEYSEL